MTRRILVSQECQTAGIARTLQSVLRDVLVDAKPLYEMPADDQDALRIVETYDAWVTADRHEICDNLGQSFQHVKCPRLNFASFHPDVTYVRNEKTGEIAYVANSRIVTWAYSRRLSVEAAAAMFNGEVFSSLGYMDRWDDEVDSLRSYYTNAYEMDFESFYLDVKREGIFMHDVTHPTAGGLAKFGKMIARKLGASSDELASPVVIPDTFGALSWPVYPEIADALGLVGSYIWGETVAAGGGLRGYIDYAYARFASKGFEPGSVGIMVGDGFENVETACDPILLPLARSR